MVATVTSSSKAGTLSTIDDVDTSALEEDEFSDEDDDRCPTARAISNESSQSTRSISSDGPTLSPKQMVLRNSEEGQRRSDSPPPGEPALISTGT